MIGIYKITNKINNKKYIGQSLNLEKRIKAHKTFLEKNIHGNSHLQASFNKYGKDNFCFEIIEECTLDELNDKEIYWIDFYKSHDPLFGYNKTFGGDSELPTEETKKKMSESAKGKIISKEQRLKISKSLSGKNHPNWGKHLSKETREKIANANRRRVYKLHSEETKRKMSDAHKGKPTWNKGIKGCFSEETLRKLSEAAQRNKENNTYWKGKKQPSDMIKKRSESLKDHAVTDETRRKISESQKGEKSKRYGVSPTNKIVFSNDDLIDIFTRLISKERIENIAKDYNCSCSTIKNRKKDNIELYNSLETTNRF